MLFRSGEKEELATGGIVQGSNKTRRYLPRLQSSLTSVEPGSAAHGMGVPGYLQPKSMAVIVRYLRDECMMRGRMAVFCDAGAGGAHMLMAAAEGSPTMLGCVGIEIDEPTIRGAKNNISRFQHQRWNGSKFVRDLENPDAAPPIHILIGDLHHLYDFHCATHVYCFCYGMPADTIAHVLRAAADSSHIKYLVLVFKKVYGDLANDFVARVKTITTRTYDFVDPATNRSLLEMPGQTVHGTCIRVRARVKQALLDFTDGTECKLPMQTLQKAFNS